MSYEKKKSKSVSFTPQLWEEVEEKARQEYGGNRSEYLRRLVEANLHANPAPGDERPLEKLVTAHAPGLAPEITGWCTRHGYTESQFLSRLLYHLCTAAANDELTPQAILTAIQLLDPDHLAQLQSNLDTLLHVAETRSEYPPPKRKKTRRPPDPGTSTGTG